MKQETDIQSILDQIGDPAEIARSLRAFRKDAALVSSKWSEFVKKYPDEWIAVYGGRVRASEKTLEALLERIDEIGLPRGQVFVKYMDTKPIPLVL